MASSQSAGSPDALTMSGTSAGAILRLAVLVGEIRRHVLAAELAGQQHRSMKYRDERRIIFRPLHPQ
jgi:hypothetical protein